MPASDRGAQVVGSGVTVEELGLSVGIEQRMVLVLAVQPHQGATQLAQLARVGRTSVDTCTAALPELPLEDD